MLIGKYRLVKKIGEGSFSVVHQGYNIFTNSPVAVKVICKSLIPPDYSFWILQEVDVLQRLNHPGIVQLIDFIEDENSYFLVLEYCGGGELFNFIISRQHVEEPLARRFFKQIVLAVGYLHQNNIVHRDLKPENLLLNETTIVKITDFGLCSTKADQPLNDRCGSNCYISPEALTQPSYMGQPADVWSLGVILYALVDGSLPWNYQNPDIMLKQITSGDFPMPKGLSVQCQDLLHSILNPDPSFRLTIDQILVHPWLFGVGNVFPQIKSSIPAQNNLSLSVGGFSSSHLKQPITSSTNRIETLETIFEDEYQQPQFAVQDFRNPPPELRQKPVQPRSISLDSQPITEETDDGTSTYRGVIISKTISHRDPVKVALSFEEVLITMGIRYSRSAPLLFLLSGPQDLQVSAEVCRLYGFRNVYTIAFNRLRGDSWNYTQFVTQILNQFTAP